MNRLSSATSKPSGRAKSCTPCRQAKVACDARKTLNGPCSRCRSKDLDCRFDANFKRVSTRRCVDICLFVFPLCTILSHKSRLTEQISHEVHASRSAEETSHATPFLRSLPNFQSIPQNEHSAEPALCASDMQKHAVSWLDTTDSDAACSYNLGRLNLESATVIELFQ